MFCVSLIHGYKRKERKEKEEHNKNVNWRVCWELALRERGERERRARRIQSIIIHGSEGNWSQDDNCMEKGRKMMVGARKRMMITNRISFFSFDPMFEEKKLPFRQSDGERGDRTVWGR